MMSDEMMLQEDEYQELKDKYLCWEASIDGYDFTVFIWQSKVILFTRKVYYEKNGDYNCIYLHALKAYKSIDDAANNIDGDLLYYIYSPMKEGDVR